MSEPKAFLRCIFDFSFDEFVTTRIIKLLYGITLFGSVVLAHKAVENGLYTLPWKWFSGILCYLLFIVISRVFFELIIVVFRIAENTGKIADRHMAE